MSCLLLALGLSGAPPARAVGCTETLLTASDAAPEDYFGFSVALFGGNLALVGAPRDDDSGTDSGSAYVFRHDGCRWNEEAKLVASDGFEDDFFGASVSLMGDLALVGAWGDEAGSAYVFRHDGLAWVEEAKLEPRASRSSAQFGASVSLSNDVALIGAPADDEAATSAGAAYVFRRAGTTWAEEAKLLPSPATAGDRFGTSVSLSDDTALVGAYTDDDVAVDAGAAYVFRRMGTSWMEEAKLVASDGAAHDCFGAQVSLSGDVAFLGAYHDDDHGDRTGAAYVFRRAGTTWHEEAKLVASDAGVRAYMGTSVAVSADAAVVGGSHLAYLYSHDGTGWSENKFTINSPPTYWLASAAVSNGVSLVGGIEVPAFAGGVHVLCQGPAVPEISPPGLDETTGAFLVRKDGSHLRLSWESTPHEAGIYFGTLRSLRGTGGYDHRASSTCRLAGTQSLLTDSLPPDTYLLVVASACGEAPGQGQEGSYGRDSLGTDRPDAVAIGRPRCP